MWGKEGASWAKPGQYIPSGHYVNPPLGHAGQSACTSYKNYSSSIWMSLDDNKGNLGILKTSFSNNFTVICMNCSRLWPYNINIIKMKYDYWRHPHLFIGMDGFGRSHTAEGSKICPGGVGRTGMVGQAENEDDHSVIQPNIYAAFRISVFPHTSTVLWCCWNSYILCKN